MTPPAAPGTHTVQLALLPQVEGVSQLLEGVFQVHGDEGPQHRLWRRGLVSARMGCATFARGCFSAASARLGPVPSQG